MATIFADKTLLDVLGERLFFLFLLLFYHLFERSAWPTSSFLNAFIDYWKRGSLSHINFLDWLRIGVEERLDTLWSIFLPLGKSMMLHFLLDYHLTMSPTGDRRSLEIGVIINRVLDRGISIPTDSSWAVWIAIVPDFRAHDGTTLLFRITRLRWKYYKGESLVLENSIILRAVTAWFLLIEILLHDGLVTSLVHRLF